MKFKNTLILGLIFVALLAYVYFYEIKGGKKREEQREKASRVLVFEKEDVTKLSIERGDQAIRCEKTNDHWKITSPVETEGDRYSIEGVISSVRNAKIERVVAEQPEDLSGYGLDPPRSKIILTFKDGNSDTLFVGEKNPTGTYAFVRVNDDPRVLLGSSSLYYSANKKLFDLRDKSVLKFERDDVESMVLHVGRKKFELEKKGEEWRLTYPISDKADRDEINKILNRLRNARAREFVEEEPEDLAEYGLDKPAFQIDLYLAPNKARKTLLVGKKKDDRYYAKDEGRKPVFLVDKNVGEVLEQDLFKLRDKRVVSFERDRVQKIALVYRDSSLVCEKDTAGVWWIVEPKRAKAKSWRVSSILTNLSTLKAKEFVSERPKSLARYGLSNPQITVEIFDKDGQVLNKLLLGKEYGEDKLYVTSAERRAIFGVDKSALNNFKYTFDELAESSE